jgi:hypothetical protein
VEFDGFQHGWDRVHSVSGGALMNLLKVTNLGRHIVLIFNAVSLHPQTHEVDILKQLSLKRIDIMGGIISEQ